MPARVKEAFIIKVHIPRVRIDNEGETANQNNEEGGRMHVGQSHKTKSELEACKGRASGQL